MDIHLLLSLFHIFAVVPLFLYVAISRANIPTALYGFLLALGAFITLYHGYKAFTRFVSGSAYLWVNLIHMLFVGPLLIYIGYREKDTPRYAYELLALLGFAALGYHTYQLIISMNVLFDDAKNK
jgi:hypothetical protein